MVDVFALERRDIMLCCHMGAILCHKEKWSFLFLSQPFHVTVEAPFLLLPSSSDFILIVGRTVLGVAFCCA